MTLIARHGVQVGDHVYRKGETCEYDGAVDARIAYNFTRADGSELAVEENRPGAVARSPRGAVARSPQGAVARSPQGADDRSPRGADDRSPRGADDRSPQGVKMI